MKIKQLLLVLVLAFVGISKTNAQAYIKINPITLAFGFFGVEYEQVVSNKNSFTANAGFYTFGSDLTGRYTGFGLGGGYRFYISKQDAPEGLFIEPNVGFSFLTYKYGTGFGAGSGSDFGYTNLSIGAIIGYQWLFSDDQFSFNIGIGPGVGIALGKNDSFTGSLSGTGFSPTGTLGIGYRISGK